MKCKTKSSETYVATEEETCLKEERSEPVVVVHHKPFFQRQNCGRQKSSRLETIILQLVPASPL